MVKEKGRYITIACLMLGMFLVLIIQLYSLCTSGQEETAGSTSSSSQRTVSTTGARGSILDANGVLLAYDVSSYNVTFYKDPANNASSDRAKYTQIIRDTIELVEANGGTTINTFMIYRQDDGTFAYDLSEDLTEADREERIASWRENMQISDSSETPEEVYNELRLKYRIPEEVEYEEAVKILSIWQESQLMTYRSYIPVTIAYNVDFNTVAEIQSRAYELTGMDIEESSTRVYPQQDTASHVIGYLGRITTDDEVTEYVDEKGYSPDDSVGKVGIEASMEDYLTGSSAERQGEKTVELDYSGSIISEDATKAAEKGDNVILNLDLELQQVVEEALADNIAQGRAQQQLDYEANKEEFDELLANRSNKEINWLKSGAAIVMDVDTGDVLALASYPTYDLNLFTGGISDEDYQALVEDDANPLFNNAIASRAAPGSVFKMITATAGLMEGAITLDTVIDDQGPYMEHDIVQEGARAPECWTSYPSRHAGGQTVVEAIRNSCNYFFYEVAYRLGIDKINEWADNFGVTSLTGIELPGEVAGFVGSQEVLYDNTKPLSEQKTYRAQLVFNAVKDLLVEYGQERQVEYTEEQLDAAAQRIIEVAGEGDLSQLGEPIRRILSDELDIPEQISRTRGWYAEIVDVVRELIWTDVDTLTTGIGSEPTQLTPIAVCRYICALVNGGKVLEPHLVDRIVDANGEVVKEVEPVVVNELNIPQEYVDAIMEGMSQVVSDEAGGTAGSYFRDFEYSDQIAGKTGTAPVSTISIEDNVWLAIVAPREDPEIALVVYLPNGLSTNVNAYPTAIAILEYYFANMYQGDTEGDGETTPEETTGPTEGTIMDMPAEDAGATSEADPSVTLAPVDGTTDGATQSTEPTSSQPPDDGGSDATPTPQASDSSTPAPTRTPSPVDITYLE